MKIKVPPHSSAPQGQTIVIREQREGCFLQTLNLGCAIVIGIVLLVVGVLFFAVVRPGYVKARAEAQHAASSSGKGLQPAAAPSASAPTAAPVASPKNEPAKPTAAPVATPKASPVVAPATPPPTPPKSPLAKWEVFKKVDEMTDATTYLFTLDGERVDINDFVSYTPKLVIRITPQSVLCGVPKYSQNVAIMIETEGFHREVQEVTIRVDSLEPVTGNLQTSTSRSAVFLPKSALKSLDGSKRLALRFTTTLGDVRTLKFNLEGFKLDDLETELIKRVRADRPKGVEIAP